MTTVFHRQRAQGLQCSQQRCTPTSIQTGKAQLGQKSHTSFTFGEPSQGADGESEYVDEAMEEDELINESDEPEVHPISFVASTSDSYRHRALPLLKPIGQNVWRGGCRNRNAKQTTMSSIRSTRRWIKPM
jgi:hypothetical protein